MHQMQLPEEILHLVIVRMLLYSQLIYLHARLLVHLVSRDVAAHDLQSSAELSDFAENHMLLILNENVLIPRVRYVRIYIEFVIADLALEDEAEVATFVVLF